MNSFDKADDAFIQAAADDTMRPALIKSTARRRTLLFWCAVVITLCALGMIFAELNNRANNSEVAGVEFGVAVMTWMQVFKCESDLRLLKLVEKLKK